MKKHFTVADVEERACRALDLAVAQGIGRMRTNVDVDFATRLISMEGVLARPRPVPRPDRSRRSSPSRRKASSPIPRRLGCCAKRSIWAPISSAACRSSSESVERSEDPYRARCSISPKRRACRSISIATTPTCPSSRRWRWSPTKRSGRGMQGRVDRRPLLRAGRLSRRRGAARHRQGEGGRDHRDRAADRQSADARADRAGRR